MPRTSPFLPVASTLPLVCMKKFLSSQPPLFFVKKVVHQLSVLFPMKKLAQLKVLSLPETQSALLQRTPLFMATSFDLHGVDLKGTRSFISLGHLTPRTFISVLSVVPVS